MRRALWGLLGIALLAGCGSTTAAVSSKAKVTFPAAGSSHTLVGTLVLDDSDSANGYPASESGVDGLTPMTKGGVCEGIGGYSDISVGATVTVENQSGTIIATGNLGYGTVAEQYVSCQFSFVVKSVPNESFYQVSVAHRGGVTYSAAQLAGDDWILTLQLGS